MLKNDKRWIKSAAEWDEEVKRLRRIYKVRTFEENKGECKFKSKEKGDQCNALIAIPSHDYCRNCKFFKSILLED